MSPIRGVVAGVASALALSSAILAATPGAAEVAQAVQKKYDTVKDFSADFTHAYEGGVLKKRISEHGTLLVKKPGKMRWTSAAPDNNVFVSDGVKIYAYVAADRQVTVSAVPPDDAVATPALFLSGKGNLVRDFSVSLVDPAAGMPAGTLGLKLMPKTPQPDYDWLVLQIEAGTYRIRGLVFMDAQSGTSTYAFTKLKENVGLADKEFEFKPPRGVDVIDDSSRR